jgi:hypothetical protein
MYAISGYQVRDCRLHPSGYRRQGDIGREWRARLGGKVYRRGTASVARRIVVHMPGGLRVSANAVASTIREYAVIRHRGSRVGCQGEEYEREHCKCARYILHQCLNDVQIVAPC